jgi:hypothetical protein
MAEGKARSMQVVIRTATCQKPTTALSVIRYFVPALVMRAGRWIPDSELVGGGTEEDVRLPLFSGEEWSESRRKEGREWRIERGEREEETGERDEDAGKSERR